MVRPPARRAVRIGVAVVDDRALSRELLARAVAADARFALVGTSASAAGLGPLPTSRVEAAVLSVTRPGPDMAADIALVVRDHPGVRVVVVATYADDVMAARLRDLGAAATLTTGTPLVDLLGHLADEGPTHRADVDDRGPHTHRHGLTVREQEILDHLADGVAPQQIARLLDIRVHTVRDHLAALRRKLDCTSATELVVTAHRLGLAPHVGRPLR